ncbi:RNA-directed DNA polymerase from mobile element jockey [Frankliniella fusca]|uniref:RNA-directed DNA polymerase from mobile element jockey n=1 Tax=Frankliniella fusca TaxID=407009 RepID=A0AAE1H918_9NEOP|nr:RNA-directed DNA polymerase from mobile element jockey [Frankliniella fusca]
MAKRQLKGTEVTVREDLTKMRLQVLKHAVKEYTMKKVWTSDGVIKVNIGLSGDLGECPGDFIRNITYKFPKKLKLVHINAQSLNDYKQAEFIELFSESEIDIIVVSETWLKDDIQVSLLNYNGFYVNRCGSRHGGGVAIFVKSSYRAKVLSTSLGEINKPEYILIEVLIGCDKLLVVGVYRPPKIGYLDALQTEIYKYTVDYKYTFLCGDLNARFGSGTDETKIISDMLSLCNLSCVPFGSTFHIPGCDSTLDLISSNCPDLLIYFGQRLASGFSAHDILCAVFDLSVPSVTSEPFTFRDFNGIILDNLLNDIETASWHLVYNAPNIDGKLEQFNNIITNLMEMHVPLKTFARRKNQPWMTKEISKQIKKREALRAKYLNTLSLQDKDNYIKARNRVKQDIRNAKTRFFHRKFEKCENNAKATWGVIRSLNLANKVQPSDLVVSVEDLNVHYASVSSVKNPAVIKNSIENYVKVIPERDNINDKFFFKYVLPEDIVSAINSIKSNAVGVDKIPVKFLKLCLPSLIPVLDHIFNYSLQNSAFPSVWKKANILPLPKVKNPKETKDYRPVSNLCVLGKALEKVVHKQVSEFLDSNKLFDKFQSGFRKNHSTVTALLKSPVSQ